MNEFGVLNFLVIKDEEVLTATYYNRLPETPADSGEEFQYDIVNEHDKSYSLILGNLQTDRTVCTIKTNDKCGFKPNGYIATQDGSLWQIDNIVKQVIKPSNKQALRLLKETAETEYIMRLIEVDNAWELE